MGISALGTGSGLPLADLTDKLVNAEGLGTTIRLDRDQKDAESLISAFGLLKVGLSSFQSSLGGLRLLDGFQSKGVIASDPAKFSGTSTNDAAVGSYAIEVVDPGKKHRISSDSLKDTEGVLVADGNINIGGGTLVFSQGTGVFSVNIDPANSSVNDIKNAINEAVDNTGVVASVINTGTTSALVLTAARTGTDNEIKIIVDDDDLDDVNGSGLSQLFYDPASLDYDDSIHLAQDQAAADANILLDGQSIVSADGSKFIDVIEGLTINALEATEKEETLTVGSSTSNIASAVQSFVSSYNQLASTLNQLNSFDSESSTSTVLFADPLVRSVQTQLRRAITEPVAQNPVGYRTLNDIGIRFDDQGQLTLDQAKLNDSLSNNLDAVADLFAATGAGKALQNTLSTASFDTESTAVGEGSIEISVGDDAFSLEVSALLGNNTLEGIRDAINDAEDNTGVTASIASVPDGAGGTDFQLVLTSDKPGNAFAITVNVEDVDAGDTDDSGLSQLSSQQLQLIQASSTKTPTGVVRKIDNFLSGYLGTSGAIEARENGLDDTLKDISEQRETLARRLEEFRARTVAKFSALDSLVAQLNQTGGFLQQQFESISQIAQVRKK